MKTQKGFATMLAIIIGLVIIGGGIFVMETKNDSDFTNTDTVITESSEITPINSEPGDRDGTDSWKTYINNKHGLQFRYPEGYAVSSNLYGVTNPEEASELSIRKISTDYSNVPTLDINIINSSSKKEVQKTQTGYDPAFEGILDSIKTFEITEDSLKQNNEKEAGYIKDIYLDKGNYYLDIDYAIWVIVGNEQSIELCGDDEMSNGYCIVNDNPLIRTFSISDNVIVKMATFSHTEDGNFNGGEVVSLEKFIGIYDGDIIPAQTIKDLSYSGRSYNNYFDDALYWVTIEGGVIIEIQQQYQP